jgi:hypothetical protein
MKRSRKVFDIFSVKFSKGIPDVLEVKIAEGFRKGVSFL